MLMENGILFLNVYACWSQMKEFYFDPLKELLMHVGQAIPKSCKVLQFQRIISTSHIDFIITIQRLLGNLKFSMLLARVSIYRS